MLWKLLEFTLLNYCTKIKSMQFQCLVTFVTVNNRKSNVWEEGGDIQISKHKIDRTINETELQRDTKTSPFSKG